MPLKTRIIRYILELSTFEYRTHNANPLKTIPHVINLVIVSYGIITNLEGQKNQILLATSQHLAKYGLIF